MHTERLNNQEGQNAYCFNDIHKMMSDIIKIVTFKAIFSSI